MILKAFKYFFGALALMMAVTACGNVPAGYEGVKVNLYGSEKGVQVTEAGVGWHFVPPGHELHKFPTFTQQTKWEKHEKVCFQDRDGLELCAEIGMNYFVEKGRADEVFVKFREGINTVTNTYLKNNIRDSFVNQTSSMSAEEIYSTKKNALLAEVNKAVKAQALQYGLVVESVYFLGPIQLPPEVIQSINAKIKATQIAQQRRNEVEEAKAQADKVVEKARGDNESRKLAADAEAYSIQVAGEMLNKYPAVLSLREVQKWDGKYPTTYVTDGNTSLLMNTK